MVQYHFKNKKEKYESNNRVNRKAGWSTNQCDKMVRSHEVLQHQDPGGCRPDPEPQRAAERRLKARLNKNPITIETLPVTQGPRSGSRGKRKYESSKRQAPSCDILSRVIMSHWQKHQAPSACDNLSYWQEIIDRSLKPQATSIKLQALLCKFPDPRTTVHGYWKSFWCPRPEGLGYDKCVVWMFHMERNLMWRKF